VYVVAGVGGKRMKISNAHRSAYTAYIHLFSHDQKLLHFCIVFILFNKLTRRVNPNPNYKLFQQRSFTFSLSLYKRPLMCWYGQFRIDCIWRWM